MDRHTNVVIELRAPRGASLQSVHSAASSITAGSFRLDKGYSPVSLPAHPAHADQLAAAGESTYLVRGTIDPSDRKLLESQPQVLRVWDDPLTVPFAGADLELIRQTAVPCPFPECDCDPTTAKGDLAAVRAYLGVDQIWKEGFKGDGIVIGIVDDGIRAVGRATGDKLVPNVIGGYPADSWGTTSATGHGSMSATDALGTAENAKLYDIRCIGGPASDIIKAFDWALAQYNTNKTPQVLSNSWGFLGPSDMGGDPDSPLTRLAVSMVDGGMALVFAAGNCGAVCPSGNCTNVGPGNDIWGVNGHERMMTIGAVNVKGVYAGYSSAGPAQLFDKKPDFCGVTHFKGYTDCDNGTSAACPVVSGVVAILRQAYPDKRPDEIRTVLASTAQQIAGATGWSYYTGTGVIQAAKAFAQLKTYAEVAVASMDGRPGGAGGRSRKSGRGKGGH